MGEKRFPEVVYALAMAISMVYMYHSFFTV